MSKRRFGHVTVPLKRVHLELTNVCDFNCAFCPKSEMKRPFRHMDRDLAKRIINEIGENGVAEKITFHVMGEPTLHPDFFAILAHAQTKKVNVGLTTNGGGLGGDIGKHLLDHGLYQIDISLQTPDADSFALRKAKALTFESYVEGILNFFRDYHAKWPDTIFKLRFLNTRFPKKEIERKKGPVRVINSSEELRRSFRYWSGRIYDVLDAEGAKRKMAMRRIESLSAIHWNVVEVYPNVFFETYVLEDWGHAFGDEEAFEAWAGYCFGMRDHFSILSNGDLILCCLDFEGKTKIGNLHSASLLEILSSEALGEIIKGFKHFKLVHPHCRQCLGSTSFASWVFKPILSIAALNVLKPFFYKRTRLYQ